MILILMMRKRKMTTNEKEQLDLEIERLTKEIEEYKSTTQKQAQISQLNKQLEQLKFRKKHGRLLSITSKLEKGTIGFFKKIPKAVEALNKSDAWIEEQQRKEANAAKKKKEKGMKESIRDELDALD